jgi:hypothetical protein
MPGIIERYEQAAPNFASSLESKLLHALLDASKEGDQDKFEEAIQAYDRVTMRQGACVRAELTLTLERAGRQARQLQGRHPPRGQERSAQGARL